MHADDTRDRNAALRQATAETCARAIHADRSLDELVDMMAALLTNADLLVAMLIEHPQLPKPACHSGCAFCCHRPVHAAFSEIILLYCFIREYFSRDEIEALRERLQRDPAATVCPLLDLAQGSCMVYPARPLACRATHSYSAPACEADFLHTDQDIHIPQRLEVLAAVASLQGGVIDGLIQSGLKEQLFPLGRTLAALFTNPASVLAFIDGIPPITA